MNELKVFENAELGSVRVVMRDGEPWFVARDVCEALGLENVTKALSPLDDDEKITLTNSEGNPRAGIPLMLSLVSEPGLYSLVLRSRKQEAKEFKRWVTHDILPSIRKTGIYSIAPKSYAEALRALAAEVELREAVEAQKALAESQRDEAIRTKAEIGSRREATSMATASAAVRQRDALADKLGEGKHYKTARAIPWLLGVFAPSRGMYQQVGKKLTAISARMGHEVRTVEDSKWGTVKAYHVEAIEALRLELAKDVNMLGRYRKA